MVLAPERQTGFEPFAIALRHCERKRAQRLATKFLRSPRLKSFAANQQNAGAQWKAFECASMSDSIDENPQIQRRGPGTSLQHSSGSRVVASINSRDLDAVSQFNA
jgi:hypothetical protein